MIAHVGGGSRAGLAVALASVLLLACGSTKQRCGGVECHGPPGVPCRCGPPSNNGASASSANDATKSGGGWAGGGAPSDAGGPSQGATNHGTSPATCAVTSAPDLSPGPVVVDVATKGTGDCASSTLGDVLARIHRARPELADIQNVFDPKASMIGDGSFVYAFGVSRGFALALKRGGGDCPAGCTENEYWYFTTDTQCAAQQVGHYNASARSCIAEEGQPMWGRPPPYDPKYVCNANLAALDISGTYRFRICGQSQPCALSGDKATVMPVDAEVMVDIGQDLGDLSTGSVTIHGTGSASIDDRQLPAQFMRKRVLASQDSSNLPAQCPDQVSIAFQYDFEGWGDHVLSLSELRTPDCQSAPQQYCKGSFRADVSIQP